MTRRSSYPVTSFGPELMALLIKGSQESVLVPCTDAKELQYLQMRIHMLRGAMSRERHPQLEVVQRARTSRQWKTDPDTRRQYDFTLLVEPNDLRFRASIAAAGVIVDEKKMDDLLDDDAAPLTPIDPSTEPNLMDPSDAAHDPYAMFKPRN